MGNVTRDYDINEKKRIDYFKEYAEWFKDTLEDIRVKIISDRIFLVQIRYTDEDIKDKEKMKKFKKEIEKLSGHKSSECRLIGTKTEEEKVMGRSIKHIVNTVYKVIDEDEETLRETKERW